MEQPAFTPWDPEVRRNPYPQLKALREQDPVHRFELLQGWVVTRYEDCVAVLRDGERFSSRARDATVERQAQARQTPLPLELKRPIDAFFEKSPLFSDRPDHTRLRGLLNRGFTPRVVTSLRPRIETIVHQLIDRMLEQGEAEFMRDFANPLPAIVIAELLGVPVEDQEQFKEWSDGMVALLDPVRSGERQSHAIACAREIYEYLGGIIAERRRRPGDDLISRLVALEASGEGLAEQELFGTCMLLLVAGHETTTNLLGNGLYNLLEHPDQHRRLLHDRGLVRSAVEELLRYESPVMGMPRVVKEPCEIGGQAMVPGEYIVVVVGAANRDPEQFPDPERLDIGRRNNKHLAFGFGGHFCLGAPLARAEAEIAFDALLARAPQLKGDYAEVGWKETLTLRGIRELRVRF